MVNGLSEERRRRFLRFCSSSMVSESKSMPELRFTPSVPPLPPTGEVAEARKSVSTTDTSSSGFQRTEFQYFSDNSNLDLSIPVETGADSLPFKVKNFAPFTDWAPDTVAEKSESGTASDQKPGFQDLRTELGYFSDYSISNLLSEEVANKSFESFSKVTEDQKPVSMSEIYCGIPGESDDEMSDFYNDMVDQLNYEVYYPDHIASGAITDRNKINGRCLQAIETDGDLSDNGYGFATSEDVYFDKNNPVLSRDSSGKIYDKKDDFREAVTSNDVCFDEDDLMPSFDVIASDEIKWRKNLRRMKLLDFLNETRTPMERINKMFEIADRIGEEIAITKLRFNLGDVNDLSDYDRLADNGDKRQQLPSDYDSWSDNSHDDIRSDDSDKDISSDDWDNDYDPKVSTMPILDVNEDGKNIEKITKKINQRSTNDPKVSLTTSLNGCGENDVGDNDDNTINDFMVTNCGDEASTDDENKNDPVTNLCCERNESFDDVFVSVAAILNHSVAIADAKAENENYNGNDGSIIGSTTTSAIPNRSAVAVADDQVKRESSSDKLGPIATSTINNNSFDGDERKAIDGEESKIVGSAIISKKGTASKKSEFEWLRSKETDNKDVSGSSIMKLIEDDCGDEQQQQQQQQHDEKQVESFEKLFPAEIDHEKDTTARSGDRRYDKAGKGPIFVSEQKFGIKAEEFFVEHDGGNDKVNFQHNDKELFEGSPIERNQGNDFPVNAILIDT